MAPAFSAWEYPSAFLFLHPVPCPALACIALLSILAPPPAPPFLLSPAIIFLSSYFLDFPSGWLSAHFEPPA